MTALAPPEPRGGPLLLDRIDAEHSAWRALIGRLGDDALRPVYGAWSAVDTLVHVTSWNENALTIARSQRDPGSDAIPPTRGPAGTLHLNVDRFNAETLAAHRGWSAQRALAWSDEVHQALRDALAALPTGRLVRDDGRRGGRMWFWMPAVHHSGGHRRALERALATAASAAPDPPG